MRDEAAEAGSSMFSTTAGANVARPIPKSTSVLLSQPAPFRTRSIRLAPSTRNNADAAAMSPAEVTEKLGLHKMRDRSWYVHPR